jgi:hypothetical protein
VKDILVDSEGERQYKAYDAEEDIEGLDEECNGSDENYVADRYLEHAYVHHNSHPCD